MILTNFAGKKLCAGSFSKCQLVALQYNGYSWLWSIDSDGTATLYKLYGWA